MNIKRIINKKSLHVAILLSTSLYATNGVNLIGTGTVSRSMGGTGVAYYSHSVEAIGKNPALMSHVKKNEFQFDYTFFSADVSATQNFTPSFVLATGLNTLNTSLESLAKEVGFQSGSGTSVVHYDAVNLGNIGATFRVNHNLVLGIGFISAAGLGVDYVESPALRKFKTSLVLGKIVPAISYKMKNVTLGFSPVIGIGSMSMNYDEDPTKVNADGEILQSTREGFLGTNNGGDTLVPSLGYLVGMEIQVTKKLRIAQTYQSAMSYTYKNVANFEQFGYAGLFDAFNEALINNDIADLTETLDIGEILSDASASAKVNGEENTLDNFELEQPWEFAIGASYDIDHHFTVTMDYRYIAWSQSAGYSDFGWSDQSVYAIGGTYDTKYWALRAGYNYAKSPLAEINNENGLETVDIQGHSVVKLARTMMSTIGFPAIAQTHYTLGGSILLSEAMNIDFALVYSPQETYKASGYLVDLNPEGLLSVLGDYNTNFGSADNIRADYEYTTTMKQMTFSFGLNYLF